MNQSRGGYKTAGCTQYATLGGYTGGSACSRGISPPVPTTNVSGYYIVPSYSAPGYNTLQHGDQNSCRGSNYFNIYTAYGQNAGNCQTKYMGAICQ